MVDDVIKNPMRTEYVHRAYEPEYKRLNREPQVQEVDKFVFAHQKGRAAKRIIEEPEQSVPNQKYVHVGNNRNWFDSAPKEDIMDVVDNAPQPEQSLASAQVELEVEIPEEPTEAPSKPPSVSELQINEYCLMLSGDIIATSQSKDSLIAFMEDILFGPNFKEISVDDLCLLKRLPIKVGVLVVES